VHLRVTPMDIYLYRGEQQEGPFDEITLRQMVAAGSASSGDMAWHEGQTDWKPLMQVLPPPPPPRGLPRGIAVPLAESPSVPANASVEETLWKGHPSNLNYFGSWFFGILFCVGGVIAIANEAGPGAFVAAGIGVLMILWVIIAVAKRRYVVTSRRVFVEIGLLMKSRREVRIKDVRSINVLKRGISGLMGIGTVEFSSAARDDADVIFVGVQNADSIRKIVSDRQE